jgi:hypothetical protein
MSGTNPRSSVFSVRSRMRGDSNAMRLLLPESAIVFGMVTREQ